MKIKFTNIHVVLAIFSMIAVGGSFFFSMDTYYDDSNRWFMLALLAAYGFMFRPYVVKHFPVIGYFGVFIYLFICQRFVIASYYTAHNWEHNYYTSFMVQETLWIMALYVVVFYAMLYLLNGQFLKIFNTIRGAAQRINDVEGKMRLATAFFLIFSVLSFIVVFNESVNGHNNALSSSIFHRFFLRLILPEFFLAMLFGLFLLACKNKRRYVIGFVFVLIYYVLMRAAQGSKSGIFDLAILILMYILLFNNRYALRVNMKTAVIGFSIISASILVFSIIGYIRFSIWYHAPDAFTAPELANEPILRLWNSFSEISRRLGIFDDAMKVIYWREMGFIDISGYVNVETVTKLSIDALLPSVLYPDLLKAQYALALMIGNEPTIINGVAVYAGYWWGFFGYHIYVFGAYKGLLVMAGFILLSVMFIRLVLAFSTNTFKVTFGFLFIPPFFFNYLGFFGYEHLLSLYFNIPVLWVINYFMFVFTSKLINIGKNRKRLNVHQLRLWMSHQSNMKKSEP